MHLKKNLCDLSRTYGNTYLLTFNPPKIIFSTTISFSDSLVTNFVQLCIQSSFLLYESSLQNDNRGVWVKIRMKTLYQETWKWNYGGELVQHTMCKRGQKWIALLVQHPETRFSEPPFSEILDLMNILQLPFSYFTLYPDSI